jgi:hypothetical protein
MKQLSKICIVVGAVLLLSATSVTGTTWTVDDDLIDCPTADFNHPQDAINAAAPYDTVMVYPGIYGSSDACTPALIVYKDGLTIEAVDPDAGATIIQIDHNCWSSPEAIQAYTAGAVCPNSLTAPNIIAIIARNATISGFTLRTLNDELLSLKNTAGVMIGGLFVGDGDNFGSDENTVMKCVFENVWHAVLIWHSSDNMVVNNYVAPLGSTGHFAAMAIYDGYTDDQINLGHTSMFNKIVNNTISDKAIFVGALPDFGSPSLTVAADNTGTKVHANIATGLATAYSSGKKVFSGNKVSFISTGPLVTDAKFPGESNTAPPGGWKQYLP